ncbi:hypothetical protein PVAP13_2NG127609 [Panicum virgatum]|uniref:CCHC-type domain-containing protein n=1 Tax=Panicum virgatum TaxID=38727 RepID=A0A8T0VEP8_PANVG|nr:hypothetical protein PVAP13_2NG127609 [Panicum virgatum]
MAKSVTLIINLSDGLRIVSCDADTLVMMSVVHKFRQFVLYVDHDDHIAGLNWEDIVVNPIGSLPNVLSPRKVEFVEKKENVKLPDFYSNLDSIKDVEQYSGEGSDSEDEDFVDSDYDMEDDDDLFWDNVDEVVDEGIGKGKRIGKGKGLAVLEEEELSTDEDDLQAPDSDGEGQIRMGFKSFRAVDMQNPTFKVGMLFETVEQLRKAITEYSLKERTKYGGQILTAVASFMMAYGNTIWPCKDKSAWVKVDASEVLPPVYEKKVGRPPKSRRKQPYEIQGPSGPKLTKHGVIITCRYCGKSGHNRATCDLRKQRKESADSALPDEEIPANSAGQGSSAGQEYADSALPDEEITHDEPIISQVSMFVDDTGGPLFSQLSSTMASQMMAESTQTRTIEAQPLPEPSFIMSNIPAARPMPPTTATKARRSRASKRKTNAPKKAKSPKKAKAPKNDA